MPSARLPDSFTVQNEDVAAAVTWGMLLNFLGILFTALSDIFING